MGFGGISSWQLLILLLIIVLIFGTKRLRNIGGDLGEAVKGFKQGMDAPEKADTVEPEQLSSEGQETGSSEQTSTTAEKS